MRKINFQKTFSLRLSDSDYDRLNDLALKNNETRAAFVRELIERKRMVIL
jgi:predicted DNA-binding protein